MRTGRMSRGMEINNINSQSWRPTSGSGLVWQLALGGVLEEEREVPNGTLGLWEMTLAMTPLTVTPRLIYKGCFSINYKWSQSMKWWMKVMSADDSSHVCNPAAWLHEELPEQDAWFGGSAITAVSFRCAAAQHGGRLVFTTVSSKQIIPEIPEKSRKAEVYLRLLRQMHQLCLSNMAFTQRLVSQQTSGDGENGGKTKLSLKIQTVFVSVRRLKIWSTVKEFFNCSLNWARFVFLCLLWTLVQTAGQADRLTGLAAAAGWPRLG